MAERVYVDPSETTRSILEQREGLTDLQADAAQASYIGKWVRVWGAIIAVGSINETITHVGVVEDDDGRYVSTLWFDGYRDRLMEAKQYDIIEAMGCIDSISTGGMRLKHCELVGVRSPELRPEARALAQAPKPAPSAPSASKNPGGRPPLPFWEQAIVAVVGRIWTGELQPQRQADVQRALEDWMISNGHNAGETQTKLRAKAIFEAFVKEGE